MNHPDELLPDYLLGLLGPAEAAELEAHLAQCERCRAELRRLNEVMARWVDELPGEAPPELWPRIAARLPSAAPVSQPPSAPGAAQPWWRPWLLAASLLVAALGLGWGGWQASLNRELGSEQRKVAAWLSRDDVRVLALPEVDGRRVGSVLLLSDGRALFVMREAPADSLAYQAWGHRDGERVPLGLSSGTLLEVPYEGFEFIGLSLEPRGGSPQPTRPLGRVPVS